MKAVWEWTRNGLALIAVLALAFWFGAGRTVKASSGDSSMGDVQFQLTSVGPSSSLLVYQPRTKTVYVYLGATGGNSAVQCAYMFQLDRPGDEIRRAPCEVPRLNP
jgi:hypothetical protein